MALTPPVLLTAAVALLVGCPREQGTTGGAGSAAAGGGEVVPYMSVDQVFSEPLLKDFERTSGTKVSPVFDTEETKSTGVLNRIIAEAQSPRADVFWSGDPVRPFLLIKRGLVEPYVSPKASRIPAGFRAADGTWTGFAARARILLVNTKRLGTSERPRSVRDLADPRWKGQTAMANPLFGTTTMHVAALFAAWGDDAAGKFLDQLKENGVRIASSNGEVKRLVVSGEVTFGLTDSDDAFEAVKEGAPVEVIYPDQMPAGEGQKATGTLVIPTTLVLLKGPHREAGRRLIDHLLSPEVELKMAEKAAHMPLGSGVKAPAGVKAVSDLVPMAVDYARLGEVMERIQPRLRQWVGL
jgi:iron(III) transport system substrate-binding protein